MDLCHGSMMDYLQDKLPGVSKLDTSRIMFKTAFGLAYLHEKKIIHECLTLGKILLWTDNNNPDFKPIVKISRYIDYFDKDMV